MRKKTKAKKPHGKSILHKITRTHLILIGITGLLLSGIIFPHILNSHQQVLGANTSVQNEKSKMFLGVVSAQFIKTAFNFAQNEKVVKIDPDVFNGVVDMFSY